MRVSFYIHTDVCTDLNVGMGIGFLVILLMTAWMAFPPDLKGFSESLTAASRREPHEEQMGHSTRGLRQVEGGD